MSSRRLRRTPAGFNHACIALALVLAGHAPPAAADIYKYVDKYGRVTLTDRPDRSGYQKLVKTWKGWMPRGSYKGNPNFAKDREKYTPAIADAARRHNLPPALVHAVITAESAYDPQAVSSAGAVGLMQLMPETAQRFGVANRKDPVANVAGGTKYLRLLLDLFKNNLTLAVAAYNAGENAVIGHGHKIPPYQETLQYVKKVLKYYKDYSANGIGKPPAKGGEGAKPSLSIRPAGDGGPQVAQIE